MIDYLEMKNGNIDAASKSLYSRKRSINNFENWLIETYHDVQKKYYQDFLKIKVIGRTVSKSSPTFKKAGTVFVNMEELLQILSDIRSEMRS